MKQKLFYTLVFAPLLVALLFLILPLQSKGMIRNFDTNDADKALFQIEPDRLIFLLQYIGIDYGGAVENHAIINESEYEEMRSFSRNAVEWYQTLHPDNVGKATYQKLENLQKLVNQKADWAEIKTQTSILIQDLSKELNVIPYPLNTPSLTAAKGFYESACSACHGMSGDGRGFAAKELNPAPTSFQDIPKMSETTPFQFFNAITFGVAGTAMPSYQQAFTDQERWEIAFYLMTLRKNFSPQAPEKNYKFSVIDLAISSNQTLIDKIKNQEQRSDSDDAKWMNAVDYLRQNPPTISPAERLFSTKQKLNNSQVAYKNGERVHAIKLILDAYLTGIEPLEPLVLQKDRALITTIEDEFSRLRHAIQSSRPLDEVNERYHDLNKSLVAVQAALEPSKSQKGFLFIQSVAIILREGVEATLLVALMITYLVTAGYHDLKKYVALGATIGVLLGALTWLASRVFVTISPFQQEALEGVTSLLAAAVLFSVSFWIIHKIDLYKWKSFIRSQAEKALGSGSGFALAFAAFLAVFREAFETVLFYQVLWLRSDADHSSLFLGFILGLAALAILVVLIFKIGLRLPLKPFFTITGALLGLLAFVFAGYGVRELQNIGVMRETLLPWTLSIEFLEIHSTLEGLTLQFGILLSFLLGWFTVFIQKFRLANNIELKAMAVE